MKIQPCTQRPLFLRAALAILLIVGIVLPGCSSKEAYSSAEMNQTQTVHYGTVVDVAEVTVEGTPSTYGPLIGSILGGIGGGVIGSLFGEGAGNAWATFGGSIGGSIFGSIAGSHTSTHAANRLTVVLENGETIVVVQDDEETFATNDHVRITIGYKTRVQHRYPEPIAMPNPSES